MKNKIKLKHVNNLLFIAIVVVDLYIIIAPFIPALYYWYDQHFTHKQSNLKALITPQSSNPPNGNTNLVRVPTGNELIIPSMDLMQPIFEGPSSIAYATLAKGVWRWPLGSMPNQGGNTILIGHRFTYTNPRGVFYELNQVKIGNLIGV